MSRYGDTWAPYVPVAKRRAQAQRKLAALQKKGRICLPVEIQGRLIAKTFWGKKWCDNLEAYSDYANRLPRGRTYARNGSVFDLQITAGKVTALVSGSDMYEVSISVHDLEPTHRQSLLAECAGKIASLVELLQGRLSSAVMEIVTRHGSGLFPVPKQIEFRCSCPDSASLCKHVAAALYGVGARLDSQPELLFVLRHLNPLELIQQAGSLPMAHTETTTIQHQQLDSADLSALFGIDLNQSEVTLSSPAVTDKPTSSEPGQKKIAIPRPKKSKSVTPSELISRGIPRHMHQNWLRSGVLQRTEERGVYRTSKQTEVYIEDYLNFKRTAKIK